MTDYKNTLNLPRTGFPMKADLANREPERLKTWEKVGLYQKIQAARQSRPKFILHDGPPFANGDVHIGTALNKILKDFIIKYKTISGFSAPFVPGWDCHGLPIEFKVVQELKKHHKTEAHTSPVEIRKACEDYARKYIFIQRDQFKRLGVLGAWENPYLTLSPEYEAEELRLFADLVEKGFVYRGKKPVYWSIPCRTALAEAEVEYKEHVSPSIYVKFPVIGHPHTYVVIWTTTPWTLPANLAIAYSSTTNYTLVNVNGESYIVSVGLLSEIAEKCKWSNYQIIRSLDAANLAQIECKHPFLDRTAKLIAGDEFVDSTTGTGFVHIAPGHGLEDYMLGLKHGLPIYSPVNDDGCLCRTKDLPDEQQISSNLIGKQILEHHGKSPANEAVLEILKSKNALLHQEQCVHSYPHCWRSKTPVIFRAMDQWFIKIDHNNFRQQALQTIERVTWVPDWGKNRIEAAVKSRPDWCISRQRTWGVPIPAFIGPDNNPFLDARIIRAAADLIEKHGSNIWFEKSAKELWSILKPSDWKGPEPIDKALDTLDVWIDSGSSSRAVLIRRNELKRTHAEAKELKEPMADLYLEGSDQHRGWFQSSMLLSLAANGIEPFKTVLTHGFMVDADREKISKSKQGQGGYIKPQTSEFYIKTYGADVIRLWVASQDFRNDIVVSDERISKVGESYRVIRNALRYQLSNLYDFDPDQNSVSEKDLSMLDRWILEEFSFLESQVQKAYENYEFHVVYQKLTQFIAVELSAIYHDIIKDRLYCDPANSIRRRATQTVLYKMLVNLCKILSPILAFTADEAWEFIPNKTKLESVHLENWEPIKFTRNPKEKQTWEKLMQLRELALPELEKARQAKLIGKALEAKVLITAPPDLCPATPEETETLREILNISQLQVKPDPNSNQPAITVEHAAGKKCMRCWHWTEDVGTHQEYPDICSNCIAAVKAATN